MVNPLEIENTGGKGKGEGATSSFLKVSGQHGVIERAKDETPEDLGKDRQLSLTVSVTSRQVISLL